MKIKVKYFASLREQAQKNEEDFGDEFTNPYELYQSLKEKYHFSLDVDEVKVAINGEYQDFTTTIKNMDVITFIPPVAGG